MLLFCSFGTSSLADAASDKEAAAFADRLGHESLSIIADNGMSKADKQAKLEALFSENVNIDWIGKFVLGRYWKTATDQQKQQYLTNYRSFTVKHYTTNLSDFTNTNFEVSRVRPDEKGGSIVTMRIKRPQAEDVVTDFDIRSDNGQFKVYDIIVEGVSMITTQRSDFSAVVSQKGLDYLISELDQRSRNDQGVASEAAGASR